MVHPISPELEVVTSTPGEGVNMRAVEGIKRLPPEVNRHFRAGVGMVIRSTEGLYLVGVKEDPKTNKFTNPQYPKQIIGLPQGGIMLGETVWDAVRREMQEEVGIDPAISPDLDFVARYPKLTVYEMPSEVLAKASNPSKYGDGQVHRWFFFNWRGSPLDLVGANPGEEFYRLQWLTPGEIVAKAVVFKRDIYRELFAFVEKIL